jgi:hypothetical protein
MRAAVSVRRGRPTKCTPALQEQIVAWLRPGNYVETTAAAAGICKQTFYNWQQRGARAKQGRYRDFLDAIKKARAQGEIAALGAITRAAMPHKLLDQLTPAEIGALPDEIRRKLARIHLPGDWRAVAWRLERTMPQKFGRRVELTGKEGELLVPPGRLSPEQIAAAVAGVIAGARGGGTEESRE